MPFWFLTPHAVFFFYRQQIIGTLAAPLRDRQRLQDGAFIAALLVAESDDK